MWRLSGGLLSTTPVSKGATVTPGAPVTISANEGSNGIAWVVQYDTSVVRAYDATNLGTELYNTNQNATRDQPSTVVKYSEAMIANGRVYVGTKTQLVVYGLLP